MKVYLEEMRTRYELEYTLNTPTRVLFDRLSTPEGLSEWFADNVTVEGDIFTFYWDKTEARARQSYVKENKLVRFEWLDFADSQTNFFEFRVVIHELTGDTALMITDHADEEETDDAKELWDTQISYLKNVLGLTE
ncbi:MAG: START-like domain-containing protein [Bacteroidales bacterium]|nr:START-like domain-containing protein [Bacteroidales bacterium]